jgi:hypothetical protein
MSPFVTSNPEALACIARLIDLAGRPQFLTEHEPIRDLA